MIPYDLVGQKGNTKMMKNNLPLWIIGVFLSLIVLPIAFQDAYATHGTGGDDDIPPSFVTTFDENEYPISIGNTNFTFAELGINNPTTTVEIGKSIRVNLLMYDDFGPTYISQVEFYTNIRGAFSDVSHSDTSIIYKKDSPRIVLDPNGFFSDVSLTSSIVNQKLQLTFDITFAKEMEKSDIIVQASDIGNNVGTLTVSDAWQVIPAQAEGTAETPPDESADDSIPGEIKVKTLNVEKPAYFMREEILFFGTVDGHKLGSVVSIIIRNPSYNFLTLISTVPDKDGYFEAKIKTDSKFKTDGTYTATAFADDPNRGMQTIFYFSNRAPPPPPVTTSPGESTQAEPSTEPEPITTSEPVTPKPKPRPSFVDLDKDPQSYVNRYNTEPTYKNWFDSNFPDYTIYEAVGLLEPAKEKVPAWIKNNAKWWSEGQIDDGTFISGIQFLMTKKIIDIPDLPEQASEKARPIFVDPQKDPQSYVDRYNNEVSYKEWFDRNFPDYTIYEAVGLAQGIEPEGVICKEALVLIIKHNGSSVCLRLETAEKLEERGWGVMPPPCCKEMHDVESITNFEECIAAGNPAMESYPRQCRTEDGKHFVEIIPGKEQCEIAGGLWGIWGNQVPVIELCNPSTSDGGKECSDSSQCQSFCQAKEGAQIGIEDTGMCYGYELAICLQEVRNGVVVPEWCQ